MFFPYILLVNDLKSVKSVNISNCLILKCHSKSAPTGLAEMTFLKSPINGEQEGKKFLESELSFASN